jgi:hypothetical protein
VIQRGRGLPSSFLADRARTALATGFDPASGRFPGVSSTTAALLFLLDRARSGDGEARRVAMAALRRTAGPALPPRQAVSEAAVHAEAFEVAPDDGLRRATRSALDAALAALGWSGEAPDRDGGGTDTHGLMIATLARASLALGAPGYREAASRAGERAIDRRVDQQGGLLHLTGDRAQPAGLGDYAQLIRGLIELMAATGERGWLHESVRLQHEQEERLGDPGNGGYFELPQSVGRRSENKDGSDGDFISGSGVAVVNLVDLARLTGERGYRDRAEGVLQAFAGGIEQAPLAHLGLLRALQRLDRTPPGP